MGELRARDVGLLPAGLQVREVQARVGSMCTRVGECDDSMAAAQLDRFKLEVAEVPRQLQVVEAELAVFTDDELP